MKFCARYIICAISLFLTLSLIFYAFADDDRYRKSHRHIRRKHHELDPAVFKRESIGSLANCTACHITAEKGIYDDDDVKIPKWRSTGGGGEVSIILRMFHLVQYEACSYALAIVPKLTSKENHFYSADYAIYTFLVGSNHCFAVKHNGKSTWTH